MYHLIATWHYNGGFASQIFLTEKTVLTTNQLYQLQEKGKEIASCFGFEDIRLGVLIKDLSEAQSPADYADFKDFIGMQRDDDYFKFKLLMGPNLPVI